MAMAIFFSAFNFHFSHLTGFKIMGCSANLSQRNFFAEPIIAGDFSQTAVLAPLESRLIAELRQLREQHVADPCQLWEQHAVDLHQIREQQAATLHATHAERHWIRAALPSLPTSAYLLLVSSSFSGISPLRSLKHHSSTTRRPSSA